MKRDMETIIDKVWSKIRKVLRYFAYVLFGMLVLMMIFFIIITPANKAFLDWFIDKFNEMKIAVMK